MQFVEYYTESEKHNSSTGTVHPHGHMTDCIGGKWKDGHNSGLQGVPGRGHQVSILGFMQERFQESWW